MLIIIAILFGITIGQHIKVTTSPELSAFIKASWALAQEKAPSIRASTAAAAKRIQSAAAKTKASDKTAPIQIFEITEGGEQVL
jgi:hypothetical protein